MASLTESSLDSVLSQPPATRQSDSTEKDPAIRALTRQGTRTEMPPPTPMTTLGGRTLHTLYAGSFVVYTLDVLTDWAHTFYACRDWTVTFPLTSWFSALMVTCCCVGTMLNFLLVFLCVENAFTSRHTFQAYRGGFSMILEKFGQWIVDFDCFRIAFLILILEDAPITFVNFWFLSSCRIPHKGLRTWPLFLSIFGTTVSLLWRLLMLVYSYKHYWFFQLNRPALEHINAESSTVEELRSIVGLKEERLTQYDECWPVRFSIFKAYNMKENSVVNTHLSTHEVAPPQVTVVRMRSETDRPEVEVVAPSSRPNSISQTVANEAVRAVSCCCMCWILYFGMCASVCVPCICHYTCRRNALYHRHRFARSCTKVCSTGYNIFILLFTLVVTLTLLIVNGMWLSSVQVFGYNTLPPEISQICIELDVKSKSLKPQILPKFRASNTWSHQIHCKPIFDLADRWGFFWNRKRPTPWILVKSLQRKYATIWLDVEVENAVEPVIYYDFKVESRSGCRKLENSEWKVLEDDLNLPWPYFRACEKKYGVQRVHELSCNSTAEESTSK